MQTGMNTTFEKDADKLEIPERNGGIRRTKVYKPHQKSKIDHAGEGQTTDAVASRCGCPKAHDPRNLHILQYTSAMFNPSTPKMINIKHTLATRGCQITYLGPPKGVFHIRGMELLFQSMS